ncbi:MAG: hypothetical protein K6V73_09280, partial [Firmicutes bacterium]|nr:hypothetical protein [Bacillota bacterium]
RSAQPALPTHGCIHLAELQPDQVAELQSDSVGDVFPERVAEVTGIRNRPWADDADPCANIS